MFSTPLGDCEIQWEDVRLTGFLLPGGDRPKSEPAVEPPPWIASIMARVERHLRGDLQDFSDLPYDFAAVPAFNQRVLRATLAIKAGRTSTYGELAAAMGESPLASRAVGAALGSNRWPFLIPCHRVTGAKGRMTGFSGPGGVATKAKLLALEGACLL